MRNLRLSKLLLASGWLAVQLCCVVPSADAEIAPDFLMESDPDLPVPDPVNDVSPKLTELWLKALTRPEIDMQRMTAETIARAHHHGIPDLDKAVPRLEAILSAGDSHPAARFAAARALIVLDSRGSSDKLFQASQTHGADLRQLIEPALAAWDDPSIKKVWIERLGSADTRPRDLTLAIRGLGEVGDSSALADLTSIANDPTRHPSVRLEAATAAGRIAETGLEQDAERLAGDARAPLFVNSLCAVRLLARHSSDEARRLLIDLAGHDEPSVAAAALQRLNEIDSSLVLPLAESALNSPDPQVRRQGAICLLERPEVPHVAPLSRMLADPHPGLRREVCEGLYQLSAQPDLSDPIRETALDVLAGDDWRGQEQASLLLGALKHQPAAERLVDLLESPREEVRLSSAWALRKAAVPETVPALLDHARRLTEFRRDGEQAGLDEQVAHLFEALGVLQAEEAVPLLLDYVPKHVSMNNLSRGAAIWALGRVYEGQGNAEVEAALAARILDFDPQPFEVSLVKQMSAIALARMQADDQAAMLRNMAASDNLESPSDISAMRLRLALAWAVRELTGEELPPPKPLTASQESWFLEPLP